MSVPVLLLGGDGESTRIVYHRLARRFGMLPAIIEEPVSRQAMLRVRLRRLGFFAVASQLAFMLGIRPLLAHAARERLAEIKSQYGLDGSPIPAQQLSHVFSVNGSETIELLRRFDPKVIVVNGTRIISRKVLDSVPATFINTHAGITPKYRGAHGGYWALYNNDPARCGVTVHRVDPGIDTGEIVGQTVIAPASGDSFVTYPYLQIAAALPLLEAAVQAALDGTLESRAAAGETGVWYHPGIFQYLGGRLRGVR